MENLNLVQVENGVIKNLSSNITFNITDLEEGHVFDTFAFGGDMLFCKKFFVEIKEISIFNGAMTADISLLDHDYNELVYTPNYLIRTGVYDMQEM